MTDNAEPIVERRRSLRRMANVERLWQNVVPFIAICIAGWAILGLSSEAAERRNQNCLVFERQHLTDVNQLKSTYHYLRTLPKTERGSSLTVAILRGLNAQEARARVDSAPDYCDEPHVGLPEPDPVLPKHEDFYDRAIPLPRGQ